MNRPPAMIPMKQWVVEEALRLGVKDMCIVSRVSRGKYRHLKLKRVNKRVVYVLQ